MSDETKALAGLIEPDAITARPDWDGQIALSLAISLRRIADAIDGTPDSTGIHEAFLNSFARHP